MKQSNYQKYGQLADDIIDAACAGDATAIDHVLRHYDRYINKLCTRTLNITVRRSRQSGVARATCPD